MRERLRHAARWRHARHVGLHVPRHVRAHPAEDADLLGYTGQFTIYDDDDSRRMVREIMTQLAIEQKQYPINMIRSKISTAKNAMIGPEEFIEKASSPQEQKAGQVYLELERRLRAANAMDFDDLLVRTLELLRTRPEVLEKYQERFRYISVDEYQDTNHVQYEIANLLAAKYQNLMVVGDDDQSIYSWRGADISNILDFEKDFPSRPRSSSSSRTTAPPAISLPPPTPWCATTHSARRSACSPIWATAKIQAYQASDERDEGRWIASEIEKLRAGGMSYDDMAVFYRTNAQSRILKICSCVRASLQDRGRHAILRPRRDPRRHGVPQDDREPRR